MQHRDIENTELYREKICENLFNLCHLRAKNN